LHEDSRNFLHDEIEENEDDSDGDIDNDTDDMNMVSSPEDLSDV